MNGESVTGVNGNGNQGQTADLEGAVLERYGSAAQEVEACLCLPVSYNEALLNVIPQEILEKDYGCGDPSRYVREGETVLDLGSGSGKGCYIIAQVVGPRGRVIGVDFNQEMLALARKYQDAIGRKLGYHNVGVCRGRVPNPRLAPARVDQQL